MMLPTAAFRCALVFALLQTCPASTDRDQTKTNDRDLIVGGAPSNGYPWYAVASGNTLCGASLIHEDILLTAAHCDGAFPEKGTVYVGAVESTNDGTKGKIAAVRAHPEYDSVSLNYDFMLLKLEKSMEGVETIQLNSDADYPSSGDDLTIMGFGRDDELGEISDHLQEASLAVAQIRACQTVYATSRLVQQSHWVVWADSMVCGWAEFALRGTCFGDSGGPVVSADGHRQVGVVSFGLGCATYGTPSVFARVSAAFDWIKEGVCDMSDNPPCYCDESCPAGTEEAARWESTPSSAASRSTSFWVGTGVLQLLVWWKAL